MNKTSLVIALIPVAVLTSTLFSRGSGTIPGESGIPNDAARRSPSCTVCHSGTIGSRGVSTALSVPDRSLDLNESVQVSLRVSGGPSGSNGGFAAENTGGAFSANSNTRINTSGRSGQFITHSNDNLRSWMFPYAAPSSAGLYQLYAIGMAANGGGRSGDSIALSGSDPQATQGTPVYIGVNAAGNRRFGRGCVGSFGNWAVLYSDQAPTVGNANYAVQLAGVAPNSTALFVFGVPRATPIDLAAIGATGCGLWVDGLATAVTITSSGNAQRGEGTASSALPIPNDNNLRGIVLGVQAVVADAANGRTLPITLTEGMTVTIS